MANGYEKHVDNLAEKYQKNKKSRSALEIIKDNNIEEEIDSKTVKESAFQEGITQLFTTENLQMKTELSSPLILHMSRGRIFADIYDCDIMDMLIDNIQILSVSKGRKGRQELVALVRNSQDIEEIDNNMSGIAKLMGSR